MSGLTDLVERVLLSRSTLYALRVVEVAGLTPHMRRVTFTGAELARFATNDNLHLRLALPPASTPRDGWLDIAANGEARPRGRTAPVYRKYTIRSVAPEAGHLDIDFVLHGDAGPGSAWAECAAPGDLVGAIGPGGLSIPPAGTYLIAGDETALPAIARILAFLPAETRGEALIEIANSAEEQPLVHPPGLRVTWLHRNGAAPGTTSLLADAVRASATPRMDGAFVWLAAEFDTVRAVRAHLDTALRLPRKSYLAVAYWRRGRSG